MGELLVFRKMAINRTVEALRELVPHYYPVGNVSEGLKKSPQRDH
jgi:hypothetical protein